MNGTSIELVEMADEIHKIQHTMRTALSVLQVGAHYLGKSGAEGSNISDDMTHKVREINSACDRLKEISARLKR